MQKEQRENSHKAGPPKFSESAEMFKQEHDTTLKPQSKNPIFQALSKLPAPLPEQAAHDVPAFCS